MKDPNIEPGDVITPTDVMNLLCRDGSENGSIRMRTEYAAGCRAIRLIPGDECIVLEYVRGTGPLDLGKLIVIAKGLRCNVLQYLVPSFKVVGRLRSIWEAR